MPTAFVAQPPCAVCGRPATRIELVAPGGVPAGWDDWSPELRRSFSDAVARRGQVRPWWLRYQGIVAGSGMVGGDIDEARAERITRAFQQSPGYSAVHAAGFYDDAGFCGKCDTAYCATHWRPTSTGYGTCPRGHGKSLDPHWSP
jgi:hypothetical protein